MAPSANSGGPCKHRPADDVTNGKGNVANFQARDESNGRIENQPDDSASTREEKPAGNSATGGFRKPPRHLLGTIGTRHRAVDSKVLPCDGLPAGLAMVITGFRLILSGSK